MKVYAHTTSPFKPRLRQNQGCLYTQAKSKLFKPYIRPSRPDAKRQWHRKFISNRDWGEAMQRPSSQVIAMHRLNCDLKCLQFNNTRYTTSSKPHMAISRVTEGLCSCHERGLTAQWYREKYAPHFISRFTARSVSFPNLTITTKSKNYINDCCSAYLFSTKACWSRG